MLNGTLKFKRVYSEKYFCVKKNLHYFRKAVSNTFELKEMNFLVSKEFPLQYVIINNKTNIKKKIDKKNTY